MATFYIVLQRHYVAFLDMLRFPITTRTEFERLLAVDPETLTDLERAARFLYLQRVALGGATSASHTTGRAGSMSPAWVQCWRGCTSAWPA